MIIKQFESKQTEFKTMDRTDGSNDMDISGKSSDEEGICETEENE